MGQKIFVNLPVRDLGRSIAFFRSLGYDFDARFTDDRAACLVISADIFAMLLTHEMFEQFARRPIADTQAHREVLLALSFDSRGEVDKMFDKAVAAGGTAHGEPQDHGFMYLRAYQDPDGHVWELFWMDESALQQRSEGR